MTLTSAAKNHARGHGRNRQDAPHDYYHRDIPTADAATWEFRYTLYRDQADKQGRVENLGPYVIEADWSDSGPSLQTNLTLQQSLPDSRIRISRGNLVRQHYRRHEGPWAKGWKLRVLEVDDARPDDTIAVQLVDEMEFLGRSKDDFVYKKGDSKSPHKKPDGWTADEIARDVAKRYGLKVGALAKGKHKIKNLTLHGASPLTAIQKAYAQDREETGRRFIISVKEGELTVRKLRRSAVLTMLGGTMLSASITRTIKDTFATELDVRATTKQHKSGDTSGNKKNKPKKIHVTVKSRHDVQRFGIVHSQVQLHDPVTSEAAAKRRALRMLARWQQPKKTISATVIGDPTLKRGDAVKVRLSTSGLNVLCYVRSADHSQSPGDYSTSLTLSFTDPYVDKQGDRIRKKRCEKARKHNRRQPHFCHDANFDPAAPPTHRNRDDRH